MIKLPVYNTMTDPSSDQENIICTCTGTTAAKVNQLIAQGLDDLDKIASATGASTGCGSCDIIILDLLKKPVHKPQK
ncbi:MAG: (2Fe-2S)-binding protein [Methyloprofundus sp.]|nr:(2Fe-2S)-binding protein [Methyloprofundus sp.]